MTNYKRLSDNFFLLDVHVLDCYASAAVFLRIDMRIIGFATGVFF